MSLTDSHEEQRKARLTRLGAISERRGALERAVAERDQLIASAVAERDALIAKQREVIDGQQILIRDFEIRLTALEVAGIDVAPSQIAAPSIDSITRAVARHYNVSVKEIRCECRTAGVVRPRQIAMYLCRMMTTRSYPVIGRAFGDRDHTTAMHAVRKISVLVASDEGTAREIDVLKSIIAGPCRGGAGVTNG